MPTLVIGFLIAQLRRRWQIVRDTKDAGYSTETVLIVSALAALALAVVAIITVKVLARANSINLG